MRARPVGQTVIHTHKSIRTCPPCLSLANAERCKRWRNRLSPEVYQQHLEVNKVKAREWRAAKAKPVHVCDDCGTPVPDGNFDVCPRCLRERASYRSRTNYNRNRVKILARLKSKRDARKVTA